MRRKDESKMQRIVEFIDERYNHCGVVPTIAEIGEHMGMEDGNVHRYLSDMASRGMIVKGKGWKSIVTQNMQKQWTGQWQAVSPAAQAKPHSAPLIHVPVVRS